jgi:N-acetylneuraminate synthase
MTTAVQPSVSLGVQRNNGDLSLAKKLIDVASLAGCDAVKFQKRVPELAVPEDYRDVTRETPWGLMSYLEYRKRVELTQDDYAEIDRYCQERGLVWFASCWDEPSVDFIEQFGAPCYKVASASLTDHDLHNRLLTTRQPLILSTGMSSIGQIDEAVTHLGCDRLLIAHCTSTYPCPPKELNLRMIRTLTERFDCPIGYSGHEVGLQTTIAAVVLGATFVERHITLDRAMWGTDQAASIEPPGLIRLVRDIRTVEQALGTGRKEVYQSEEAVLRKLRRQ